MAKEKSRIERWADAIAQAKQGAIDGASEGLTVLDEIRAEYEEWRDNMPQGLDDSPVVEKLEAVLDLSFNGIADVDELQNLLEEAEGMDLPLGFGRD